MLSVVIPAYNEEASIGRCLEALMRQTTREPFEVIVVDNASTDRTAEVAQHFAGKLNLRVLREPKKGRGAARAAGFRAAKGEIIFSTDADAEPPPQWLEIFAQYLRKGDAIAVTGSCRIEDCGWFKNSLFNICCPLYMRSYALIGKTWVIGCNFAVRKEAYDAVGGFNARTDGLEDMELGWKLQKIGRIGFLWRTPVTVSGRRFRHGLLRGLWDYIPLNVEKFLLRKDDVPLRDVR